MRPPWSGHCSFRVFKASLPVLRSMYFRAWIPIHFHAGSFRCLGRGCTPGRNTLIMFIGQRTLCLQQPHSGHSVTVCFIGRSLARQRNVVEAQSAQEKVLTESPAKGCGGAAWESNPPWRGLPPNTGFEDQAGHQTERRSTTSLAHTPLSGIGAGVKARRRRDLYRRRRRRRRASPTRSVRPSESMCSSRAWA